MMTTQLMCATLVFALAAPVLAQEHAQQTTPAAKPPATAPTELSAPREPAGSNNTNVRVELTITDQRAEGPAVTKTVTAIVTDRNMARIRTSGSVRTPMGMRDVILNIDARPDLLSVNGVSKVRLNLTIEYRPVA